MIDLKDMDIIIPVRDGDDNESLRYCLRSIEKNMPHRNIIIAGYKPEWLHNVKYVETVHNQPNKYMRVSFNIMTAAGHEDASESVILFNDDMFALDEIKDVPAFHRGPMSRMIAEGMESAPIQRESMIMTRDALLSFGIEEPMNYELHAPMVINTHVLLILDAVLKSRGLDRHPIQLRSLYGNMHHIGGAESVDVKLHDQTSFNYREDFPFISTTDKSFDHGLAGEEIRARFPVKSKYEL